MKRIGLLGGSFDPVHRAHIALARSALRQLSLDEVQLIPAADPWQKRGRMLAPGEERLAMLHLAVAGEPGLVVNASEISRGGLTYTVDTLLALPADAAYTWILGSDQLGNFCTWHRWQDIAGMVDLAVAERPGFHADAPVALQQRLAQAHRTLHRLVFDPQPISATHIRERLANGLPTDGMLDVAVAQYIQRHGLYGTAESDPAGV